MRYKDGKGESISLPYGLLPHYQATCLHIVFYICVIPIGHYKNFILFSQSGTSCGGLRKAIYKDISLGVAQRQMIVLDLIGKYMTGPRMSKFYVAPDNKAFDIVSAIEMIMEVNARIKEQAFDVEFSFRLTD